MNATRTQDLNEAGEDLMSVRWKDDEGALGWIVGVRAEVVHRRAPRSTRVEVAVAVAVAVADVGVVEGGEEGMGGKGEEGETGCGEVDGFWAEYYGCAFGGYGLWECAVYEFW